MAQRVSMEIWRVSSRAEQDGSGVPTQVTYMQPRFEGEAHHCCRDTTGITSSLQTDVIPSPSVSEAAPPRTETPITALNKWEECDFSKRLHLI